MVRKTFNTDRSEPSLGTLTEEKIQRCSHERSLSNWAYWGGDDFIELPRCLIITKFVLRYFDSWIWNPKELPVFNPNLYSKSYHFYYQRYLMYCYLPRCVHSISQRYRTTMIFGQDVLRYTFKSFKSKLLVWCYKESIGWSRNTKFYCLSYLPIYMDLLEQQIYAVKSPMWDFNKKYPDEQKNFYSRYLDTTLGE